MAAIGCNAQLYCKKCGSGGSDNSNCGSGLLFSSCRMYNGCSFIDQISQGTCVPRYLVAYRNVVDGKRCASDC